MKVEESKTTTPQERVSCSEKAYEYLLEQILAAVVEPGDEINRKEIADDLGISLAPVNEAIGRLAMDGFLEISPRKQTRVKNIRREEIRGLLILREAIECHAARLYCGQPVTAARESLLELAKAVDSSEPGTRENELAEIEFHVALVGLVRSSVLTQEFEKLMRRKLFHKINLILPRHRRMALDNHQSLLKKLQGSNSEEAEKLMRAHLERGREDLLSKIDQ